MSITEQEIISLIENNQELESFSRIGLCRLWTFHAVKLLLKSTKGTRPEWVFDAREIEVEPGLDHSFIRASSQGRHLALDGTGTMRFGPFFGLEADAQHLADSHPDQMLNAEIELLRH